MARVKPLEDDHGVIREASRSLPSEDLKVAFLEAIAELEDNDAHRTRTFPKTRLHRVTGLKQAIYRADVTKTSGWRIHVQYDSNRLALRDLVRGKDHDEVIEVIKAKANRYK